MGYHSLHLNIDTLPTFTQDEADAYVRELAEFDSLYIQLLQQEEWVSFEQKITAFRQRLAQGLGSYVLVISDEGSVAGMGSLLHSQQNPQQAIYDLCFIREEHRRQGLLRTVTQEVINRAREVGAHKIIADPMHETSERALYEFGFIRHEIPSDTKYKDVDFILDLTQLRDEGDHLLPPAARR